MDRSAVDAALELLQKYDRPGPRYTSYPTAVEFSPEYGDANYRESLNEADQRKDEPLSLYVHLPFCEERCTYCGCNVVITRKREVAVEYLDYLEREIELLAQHLPQRRTLAQYHWGGGTPTYLDPKQMEALQSRILKQFNLAPNAEVAIEVDPRVTTREQLECLLGLGFNRISLGVQDFTPEVQVAINRHQTIEQTRTLYETCRQLGFGSINFDLVYGLPMQNMEQFEQSLDTVADLRPDRIALYSYAHVPWLKAHQKRIDPQTLPAPELKLRLFCAARQRLLDAGYAQIGMDHFALPGDELVRAMERRELHRNFMGYTVSMGSDMVGLGVSAIGDVAGSFAQNAHKLAGYYRGLDAGRFPVERGYSLDPDDLLRREIITSLMCNFYLDTRAVERRHGIEFQSYFGREMAELASPDGPVAHGFIEVEPERLEVVGNGRLFIRNICMVFDRHLREKQSDGPVFSRTV